MASAADKTLQVEIRESFGKGAARKLRAAGKIPAVLYGHGTEPQHLSLPGHETTLILRKANAILDLKVDGKGQLALVKDVQKDPVHQVIEHLDLFIVKKGEKVEVEVGVHLEGEPAAGMIADLDLYTLRLSVEATHIPENVVIDIEGLDEGAQVLAGEVKLPKGAELIEEADALVVNVHAPQKVDLGEDTTEAAEDEAAEPAAESAE